MSEKAPRSNPRLENFAANKAAFEQKKFEEELYGEAGTTDFSDEAHARVKEADEYERHMEKLAAESRSDFDRGLDRLESGEESSRAYDLEWEDAKAENDAFDARKAAETDALAEKFATNANLRQMDRISEEVERLRHEGKDARRLHELEDRLEELLIKYSESDDYDQHIADMLMDRGDEKALASAAKKALEDTEKTEVLRAPKDGELIDEEEITEPKDGSLDDDSEKPEDGKRSETTGEPKDGELTDDASEEAAGDTDTASPERSESKLARARRLGVALLEALRRRDESDAETPVDDAAETEAKEEATPEKEPMKLTVGTREKMSSYHTVSEDYLLSDVDNKIFGVFDGMGGQGGSPDAASRAAGEAAHKSILEAEQPTTPQELLRTVFDAFTDARENVTTNGEGGSTVATLIRLAEIDGENYLAIAHAGDTRLFGYRTRLRELTTDQSNGNIVDNGMISGMKGNSLDEYKLFRVPKGLRLMMCSDGITGDWEHQFLSEAEMTEAFTQPTPDAAAQRFLELSKKDDDKTVIVIDVE